MTRAALRYSPWETPKTKNPAGWLGFLRYRCLMTRSALRGAAFRRSALRYASWGDPQKQSPDQLAGASLNKCLTMTYSRMGRPHTTIGAKRFHF